MSFSGDLYNYVEPSLVSLAAAALIAGTVAVYNKVAGWVGASKITLDAQHKAAANSVVQSAISHVADEIHSDVVSGKVQLTKTSIENEASNKLPQLYSKVPEAIAASGVSPSLLALSIAQGVLGKLAAAKQTVAGSAPLVAPAPSVSGGIAGLMPASEPIPVALVGKP